MPIYIYRGKRRFHCDLVWIGARVAEELSRSAPGEGSLDTKSKMTDKTPETSPGKKPYKTPTLRFENVFEVSALSCGKLSSTQSQCIGATKTS